MKRLVFILVLGLVVTGLTLTSCSNTPSLETFRITVATDATLPPFESINAETKAIEGIDIDIIQAIAARQNLEIELKNVPWDPLLTGMSKGKYDAAISAITINDERKKDMLFSNPYFAAGQVIVVKKDNSTITGKDDLRGQVGIQEGSTGDAEVKKIKSAVAKPYEEIGIAFLDLMEGKIEAVVVDNPFALLYVGKNPDKLKTVGKILTDEKYGIAVSKDRNDLLKRINAGLKNLRNEGLIEQYTQKWMK